MMAAADEGAIAAAAAAAAALGQQEFVDMNPRTANGDAITAACVSILSKPTPLAVLQAGKSRRICLGSGVWGLGKKCKLACHKCRASQDRLHSEICRHELLVGV